MPKRRLEVRLLLLLRATSHSKINCGDRHTRIALTTITHTHEGGKP